MRVLVTFGTKQHATEEIAGIVGHTLEQQGHQVDVVNAEEDRSAAPYDAVVVGGALYAWRWVSSASRFVRRHEQELRARPVWFFSSGPLDDSATERELPMTWPVRRLAERVGAVEHKTFGGRMSGTSGSALPIGDWRHTDQIQAWARHVASDLTAERARPRPAAAPAAPARASVVAALCFFSALSAIFGGAALVTSPDGSWIGLPLSVLQHAPFVDFFMPGLILFSLGVLHLVAGVLALKLTRARALVPLAAGLGMVSWIFTEMAMLRSLHWSQVLYFLVGAATVWAAGQARARAAC